MKKQLFLLSALALTALTSCGGGKGGFKVGLICLHDEASTYDKNFIEAFKASCEEAKVSYEIVTNTPETQACYDAAEQLVNDGFKVVFTDSFGHDEYVKKIAKEHPGVFFSSATGIGARTAGLPNYHNAFASIYEGRYLAGVAAGEYLKQVKGKTADSDVKIGYVGAMPYAEVISGYTSWYLGVKSVLPKVTMLVTYTNSWYDEAGENTAAKALIDNGCELISQHADSMGAPTACRIAGIPNVSYNMNTVDMDSQNKDTYVAHSRINWKPYYDAVLKTAVGSTIKDEVELNWTGSIGTGSVEYNVSDLVPDKKPIEAAKQQLSEGKIKVFDCSKFTVNDLPSKVEKKYFEFPPELGKDYNVDGEGHLTFFKGDTTDDYVRDTDLIKTEGDVTYIQESVFRSAPSFDIIIDGITYLGK